MKRVAALFPILLILPASFSDDKASPPESPWSGEVISALEVTDLDRSVKWYQDVFGFEIILDLREMGWVELSTPVKGSMIGLGTPQPDEKARTNGGSKISFGVRDIEAVRKRLATKGIKVPEIVDIPDTVRLLEFSDPDGNTLMLHQVPIKEG